MTRIANREKAVEVQCLPLSAQGFERGSGAKPLGTVQVRWPRSADVEALGRKAANTHNDCWQTDFCEQGLVAGIVAQAAQQRIN